MSPAGTLKVELEETCCASIIRASEGRRLLVSAELHSRAAVVVRDATCVMYLESFMIALTRSTRGKRETVEEILKKMGRTTGNWGYE